METETPLRWDTLIWDADAGTGFVALAEVPLAPRAWRYDRSQPWQVPEPHVWTPDQQVIAPGPVWCVCAATRSGNPSLRVYPLRRADAAPLVFAAAGSVALAHRRVTRREVILAGGCALLAALLPAAAPGPVYAAPEWRIVSLDTTSNALIRIAHAERMVMAA